MAAVAPLDVPERITRAEYARRRGWSRAYVTQLVDAGRVAIGPDGLLDPAEADARIAETRNPSAARAAQGAPAAGAAWRGGTRAAPPDDGARGPTFLQARTHREIANAKLAELEFRERDGQLCDRAAMEAEALTVARELREALLSLPARLAQSLAECADARDCELLLEGALIEALDDLTRDNGAQDQ